MVVAMLRGGSLRHPLRLTVSSILAPGDHWFAIVSVKTRRLRPLTRILPYFLHETSLGKPKTAPKIKLALDESVFCALCAQLHLQYIQACLAFQKTEPL